jgi:hypothetical protein
MQRIEIRDVFMNNMASKLSITSLIVIFATALGACSGGGSEDATNQVVGVAPATSPPPPPPATNNPPTISGTPGTSVLIGDTYTFTPAASDPDNDPLTFSVQGQPKWAAFSDTTGVLSGAPSVADVGSYAGIVISVSDGDMSANLPQFSLAVVQNADGSITVSWTPPTLNEDGSALALTELAEYKLYYGTSSGNHDNDKWVSVGTGLTTYVIENLTPATYFIVATAINSDGVESGFSNEATKQVL